MGILLDEHDDQAVQFDHLLGLPQAMTPITSMLGQSRGLSVLWKRVDDGKTYGIHEQLQGYFSEGEAVLVQDNVITDSKTKKDILPVIDGNGLHVVRFDVLVDREEGGREELAAIGYDLASVVGMGAVVSILAENDRITPQQEEWSIVYRLRVLASLANQN
jgi:orotate phosphoribosyltransferase